MRYCIFDVESNGLLNSVTKIHCISYKIYSDGKFMYKDSLTDYEKIVDFFKKEEIEESTLVGHNIIDYDLPLLKLILEIEPNNKIIDTLGLSNYLYPTLKKQGLEYWGERVGIPKVKVEDWNEEPIEVYIERCEIDVDINSQIFIHFMKYLMSIYGDIESCKPIIEYFNFKLTCLKEQREEGIHIDKELCIKHLETLYPIFDEKTLSLTEAMPNELGKLIKAKPKKVFKQDGTISSYGLKWIRYLVNNELPIETESVRESPNPGSTPQLKKWLFSLGWVPQTFGESKSTGKMIPKVNLPFGGGICPSIKEMYDKYPEPEAIEGYYMVKHRLGIFKGYVESCEDGKVYASANGFTKTHRLQHRKPIVNLPKPSIYFGKECREVLVIPDDSYIMVGSDVSGLEDNTKQHYIYDYDPEYVEEMRVPGFDPHLDIGVLAGLITKEEEEFYKEIERKKDDKIGITEEEAIRYKIVGKKRSTSKNTNFAATYNAYPPKIAEVAKITIEQAEHLFEVYWERNKAIKIIADTALVKIVRGQRWIFNPVSKFWLYLSADKDRFSALNQNTGVFVFDNWYREMRKRLLPLGIHIALQYHDEVMFYFKKELKDQVEIIIHESMKEVNNILKLNVEIKVSVDFGINYADVH